MLFTTLTYLMRVNGIKVVIQQSVPNRSWNADKFDKSLLDPITILHRDQYFVIETMSSKLLIYSKNTFCQGVSNDGGSHVETSSICVVHLGII